MHRMHRIWVDQIFALLIRVHPCNPWSKFRARGGEGEELAFAKGAKVQRHGGT